MKNFLIGLGLGVAGFTAAIVFTFLWGFSTSDPSSGRPFFNVMRWIGVALVFLGPLYFWLITPIRSRLRKVKP